MTEKNKKVEENNLKMENVKRKIVKEPEIELPKPNQNMNFNRTPNFGRVRLLT